MAAEESGEHHALTLLTAPACLACKRARKLLADHGVAAAEVDVLADSPDRPELVTLTPLVPSMVIERSMTANHVLIVGIDRVTVSWGNDGVVQA